MAFSFSFGPGWVEYVSISWVCVILFLIMKQISVCLKTVLVIITSQGNVCSVNRWENYFDLCECTHPYSSLPFCCTETLMFYLIFFQTEQSMDLLGKFEQIHAPQFNLSLKYMQVVSSYGRDLEAIRRIYQNEKSEPMVTRNLPPIAGRISWARQLYRRIEGPMRVFRQKPEILKVCSVFDPCSHALITTQGIFCMFYVPVSRRPNIFCQRTHLLMSPFA